MVWFNTSKSLPIFVCACFISYWETGVKIFLVLTLTPTPYFPYSVLSYFQFCFICLRALLLGYSHSRMLFSWWIDRSSFLVLLGHLYILNGEMSSLILSVALLSLRLKNIPVISSNTIMILLLHRRSKQWSAWNLLEYGVKCRSDLTFFTQLSLCPTIIYWVMNIFFPLIWGAIFITYWIIEC